MKITVKRLIEHLQGFPPDSEIAIAVGNEDGSELFIIRFIPRGKILNIIVSEEEEDEAQKKQEEKEYG